MKDNKPSSGLKTIFQSFAHNQAAGGVVLLVCAVIALIIANVPSLNFIQDIWKVSAGISFGAFSFNMPIIHWINDGLMAVFFFVVGLEIKREMLVGELSSPKHAALPIFAAIGGMLVPALIYTAFNYGSVGQNGWGIPMATDIAFAIGVISLLGKRCPMSLKVFLTALAIVDDLGAILVLAIFYPSHELQLIYLLFAVAIVIVLVILNLSKVSSPIAYIIPGIVLWYFIYMSGIHATIAGVILAATIPAKTTINEVRFLVAAKHLLDKFKDSSSGEVEVLANRAQLNIIHQLNNKVDLINPLMNRFESALHPLVNFAIMPLFALANAGVFIGGDLFGSGDATPLIGGIFMGLFLGKPIGIFLFSWIAVKLKIAQMPDGIRWKELAAVGVVAGIGFTMSIFIDNLAFNDINLINTGKATILVTSFVAAIIGLFAILFTTQPIKNTRVKKMKRSINN